MHDVLTVREMETKVDSLRAIGTLLLISFICGCGGGGSSSNNSATASSQSTVPTGQPHLSIQATAPAELAAYETGTLDILLASDGTADVRNVLITPKWAPGFSQDQTLTVKCTVTGGAACPNGGPGFSNWAVSSMPVGSTAHILVPIVSGSKSADGPISATFALAYDRQAVSSADTITVSMRGWFTTLRVYGRAPLTVATGSKSVTWSMDVIDFGPDAARTVNILNTLDSTQTLRQIVCTASGGATCPTSTSLSMTVPGIPNGGRLHFDITADVAAGTGPYVTNFMEADTAANGDPFHFWTFRTAPIVDSPLTTTPNYIAVQSDSGDWVGQGGIYRFTQVDSLFDVKPEDARPTLAQGAWLTVSGQNKSDFGLTFSLPAFETKLVPGTWAYKYPYTDAPALLSVFAIGMNGHGCNGHSGLLTIDRADYAGGILQALDLRVIHHCSPIYEDAPDDAALHAQVHWQASDHSTLPGPIVPIPAGLWSAPVSTIPTSGNYLVLQQVATTAGPITTKVFTSDQWVFNFSTLYRPIQLTLNQGLTTIWGIFAPMPTLTQLQMGYYPNTTPQVNPAAPVLIWNSGGPECDSSGWMAVDSIQWSGTTLRLLDLRFEGNCTGGGMVHGQLHWVAP